FVDVDPQSYNIAAAAIEAAITPRTRAVLPVHLYGQAAAVDEIAVLCERRGLVLIEDCAQSFGARRAGRMTGSFGIAGCFSFYPSKNLAGMGDGGLVTTSSAEFAAHLRRLRNHGSDEYGVYDETGFNSRMDELQAAVLRIKLRHVAVYNAARRVAAREYAAALAGAAVRVPSESARGEHVYHQYTILCANRERVQTALAAAGIASALHYRLALHQQRVLTQYADNALPVAERVAASCLCLPMFPGITSAQIARVARVIHAAA
ncbi:MAG: DegT/DnrJ/EryC1/StrS family aminotransferase, partial [Chromatiales bacterium]|nr:DegT/DnrJ/EryC1/StrS family aminotransferase [Chromatiales bacterium]